MRTLTFRPLPLLLLATSIFTTTTSATSPEPAQNTTSNAFTYPTFTAFISDLPPCLQVCFHLAHKPIFERCDDNNWECICRNDLYTSTTPSVESPPTIDPITGEVLPPPAPIDDTTAPIPSEKPVSTQEGEDEVPSAESLTAREILIEEFGQCVERDCEALAGIADVKPVLADAAASVSQLKAFCLAMMVPPGGAEGEGEVVEVIDDPTFDDYEPDDTPLPDSSLDDYIFEELEVLLDAAGNSVSIISSRTISPAEKKAEQERLALCTSPHTVGLRPRFNPLVFLTDAASVGTATMGALPSATPAVEDLCGRCN